MTSLCHPVRVTRRIAPKWQINLKAENLYRNVLWGGPVNAMLFFVVDQLLVLPRGTRAHGRSEVKPTAGGWLGSPEGETFSSHPSGKLIIKHTN